MHDSLTQACCCPPPAKPASTSARQQQSAASTALPITINRQQAQSCWPLSALTLAGVKVTGSPHPAHTRTELRLPLCGLTAAPTTALLPAAAAAVALRRGAAFAKGATPRGSGGRHAPLIRKAGAALLVRLTKAREERAICIFSSFSQAVNGRCWVWWQQACGWMVWRDVRWPMAYT